MKTASGEKETSEQPTSSGSGKERTAGTGQQDSNQDIKDKLAQGQKQRQDTPDTGKADSRPMDGAGQQSTQNGESSQGETQGAGGDEVASGKDRETGAGLDGSQQAGQNQREQKSGASDNGQSKQPEKSDMKTASGEKETRGQSASSGSGKEKTPETQQQKSVQGLKDKLAQAEKKAGEAGSQTSSSPTDKEDIKLSKGEKQQAESTPDDMGTGESKLSDGTEQSDQETQGSQGDSQKAGAGMAANGKGKEAGTESGGTKTAQQQQGSNEANGSKGKEPGEGTSSQITGKDGEKGQGMAGSGKEETLSSADLKNKVASQMASLSGQISALEKRMGLDVNDNMEEGKSQKHEDLETMMQEQLRKKKGTTGEIVVPGGDKPGEKLYSSKPEKIETPEGAEKMELKLEGINDELGTARETISTGKGKPAAIRKKLPTVGYDDTVKLSTQQAEDDAIRKTSIPLEYEEIIKRIHSDKE